MNLFEVRMIVSHYGYELDRVSVDGRMINNLIDRRTGNKVISVPGYAKIINYIERNTNYKLKNEKNNTTRKSQTKTKGTAKQKRQNDS